MNLDVLSKRKLGREKGRFGRPNKNQIMTRQEKLVCMHIPDCLPTQVHSHLTFDAVTFCTWFKFGPDTSDYAHAHVTDSCVVNRLDGSHFSVDSEFIDFSLLI